jgi:uncharacterized protein with ParB-like and HNH nuclease domain
VDQAASPLHSKLLLLDGQQRLTSLTALVAGKPVIVKNLKRPVEIMFNLNHPDMVTENEIERDDHDDIEEGEELF